MTRQTLKRSAVGLIVAAVLLSLIAGACAQEDEIGGGSAATTDPRVLPGRMQGVTDTEIRIGTLLPLTGPAAPWGIPVAQGMQAYYDYINEQGGMYGRRIKLFVEDSQYTGPVATEAVRKLVEQDKVFAVQGNLGGEVESAVYKYLEERGIPDMYMFAPDKEFADPVVRTRFRFMPSSALEGRVMARHVYQAYDGQKLGMLIQSSNDAVEWEQGLREGLKELNADVDVTTEYYDPTQSDVTAQVQRLKGANVSVLACAANPVASASMIKAARQLLDWDVPLVLASYSGFGAVAELAGYDNMEGAVTTMYGHTAWETDIPAMAEVKRLMAEVAPDVAFTQESYGGWVVSQSVTIVLKQAGPDLTREAFLDAAESGCRFELPESLVPWSWSPTDHNGAEALMFVRAVVDSSTDPATLRWEQFGDIVDFESTTECVVATPHPEATYQPGPPLSTPEGQNE